MGILTRLEKRPTQRAPGYAAAEVSRLTASLSQEADYINNTLRYQLRILRARSRQAAQNNPFGRRFVQMVVDNVCGPQPFRLQSKVKAKSGRLIAAANKAIEETWKGYGRKGQCDITGRLARNAMDRLIVRTFATDGEVLLRKYRGREFGKYGYQYQLIDIDRLDETKNEAFKGGGAIHMGVELDAVSRPVAYHILKRKPSQWHMGGFTREYERIPADQIVHLFIPDFAEQVRGVPLMYAALLNLIHIGAFEEAAVIAARVGASQMGIIQSPDGTAPVYGDGVDAKGNPNIQAEPGTFPTLPPGFEMSSWAPKYPDAAVEPFLKACLRGVSSGLGVAYHNLSSDMEGVNYSSARIAELDERDAWMSLQDFFIDHYKQPEYEDWLRMQVLLGNVPFTADNLERYHNVYWQGRRWAWVDPVAEVRANVEAVEAKIKSRTRVVAEQGEDIEDVFVELAEEEALAKQMKLTLEPAAKPAAGAKPPKDEPPKEDETEDEDEDEKNADD